jgi:hypothetical protein
MKPNVSSYMRFTIAVLSTVLAACSSASPVGPKDDAAAIRVSASSMTATALGQSVTVQASVVDAAGTAIAGAPIQWELSSPDVLESLGDGKFRVLKEGSVQVAAVWPKNPSIRAAVTVNVNAGLLASACISRTDQAAAGAAPKCAQRRVVVRTAPAPANVVASSAGH